MEEQDTQTTTEKSEGLNGKKKAESTRLAKAKILLDQFTLDEDPEKKPVAPISVNGSGDDKPTDDHSPALVPLPVRAALSFLQKPQN